MILPQSKVSAFVDSPQETLSFLRSGWGDGGKAGARGGEAVETGIAMENEKRLRLKSLKKGINVKITICKVNTL